MSGKTANRDRSLSVKRGEGYRDARQKLRAVTLSHVKTRSRSREGRAGESDHAIPNMKPKYLFTGKIKSNGKRDRR